MTWCAKIYDIFNAWNDDEHKSSKSKNSKQTELSKFKRTDLNFYQHDVENDDSMVIQYTSPFLEKSNSLRNEHLTSKSLYNDDYLNDHDYHREYIYDDRFFSYRQPFRQYNYNPEYRSYSIPTISNMSFNLPSPLESTETFQQLSRSFSLDLPMELKQNYYPLPSFDDASHRVRYSINSQMNREHVKIEKPNRLSLNLGNKNTNQQESVGYRISTRSSYSATDNDYNELQSRNTERIIQSHIKEMFTLSPNGVYPMIYDLPPNERSYHTDHYRIEGGYEEPSRWIFKTKIPLTDCVLISDNVASTYSDSFYEQYHFNLYGINNDLNPVVISVKPQNKKLTIIVRTSESSKCMDLNENVTNSTDYASLSQQIYPNLRIDYLDICTNSNAQELIKSFDEKLETKTFKFGIIYQRRGQTTEEEFFNNEIHSPTFDEFLSTVATKISLKNFQGYRGGLDVSEQTDSPISYYECYNQKEIMFHVSTLLPFTRNDTTQIQRKRHIGNDIVAIVFQEENTPFHPSMIKSSFLHVFLVIQPAQILSRPCYKMMLVARNDIEDFPPYLPRNVVYFRTAELLKSFILTKLINAEYAAYRCRTFSLLQERTRTSYLKGLCEKLSEKSYENLCDEQKRPGRRRQSSAPKRYVSSMKKIFTKSNSTPDASRLSAKSDQVKTRVSKKLSKLGKSIDSAENCPRLSSDLSSPDYELSLENGFINRSINARSDESLSSSGEITSSTIHRYSIHPKQICHGDESDEGLDSMSSADIARAPYDSDDPDAYRQQIREKSYPSHIWYRVSNQRHIYLPQTAGIHISEEATV